MTQQVLDILNEVGFRPEVLAALKANEEKLAGNAEWEKILLLPLTERSYEENVALEKELAALAGDVEMAPEEVYVLHLLADFPHLIKKYEQEKINAEFIYDIARDYAGKIDECLEMYDVYGVSGGVYVFEIGIYQLRKFTLGRLTYELESKFGGPETSYGDLVIHTDSPVHGLHIPAGMSFGREARMDSYRKAFAYFGCTKEKPLVVRCITWLLNPEHPKMLGPKSNLLDFMSDFDIVDKVEDVNFSNNWRLFGKATKGPLETWPTDNSLRRAYMERLKKGEKIYKGIGLLVFDGEKLLSGRGREA